MSDWAPESFIVRIVLEEGTKPRLVLGRKIQESLILLLLHFSPSKLVTKKCVLCINALPATRQ